MPLLIIASFTARVSLPDAVAMQRLLLAFAGGVPLLILAALGHYRVGMGHRLISPEVRAGMFFAGLVLVVVAAVGW